MAAKRVYPMSDNKKSNFSTASEAKKYLYHYTTLDKGLSGILGEGIFRLSHLTKMNDPMDSDPRYFTVIHEKRPQDLDIALERQRSLDMAIRGGCHVGCFTRDRPDSSFDERGIGDGARRGRMWAQYADNNRGLCLIFDEDKLRSRSIEAIQKLGGVFHADRVTYSDEGYEKDIYEVHWSQIEDDVNEIAKKALESNFGEFFLKKTRDWEHETEYRIIALTKAEEIEVKIEDCLAYVIVGSKTPDSYIPSVLELADFYVQDTYRARFGGDGWVMDSELLQHPRESVAPAGSVLLGVLPTHVANTTDRRPVLS